MVSNEGELEMGLFFLLLLNFLGLKGFQLGTNSIEKQVVGNTGPCLCMNVCIFE
jgi:hypothetical protein